MHGTYFQQVPMVGITLQPQSTLEIVPQQGQPLQLRLLDDFVAVDEIRNSEDEVDSDVIFMGYGISAPEFNWDDYAGVNVRGKVLLMLVNEPVTEPVRTAVSAANPWDGSRNTRVNHRFSGRPMTYYGRWTYKYEQAARMGAAGVILIHNSSMATYGWPVVRSSWSGERSYLRDDNSPKLKMASWVQFEVARKMAAAAGQDLNSLISSANRPGFKPLLLNLHVKAHLVSTVRSFNSPNVVGMLRGFDGTLRNEAVLFTAHYDHLGIRPGASGDNIYNGALDNASGTAMVLEIARAITGSHAKLSRSLIFACVTAEEEGLWGSEYLVMHPPVPVSRLQLDINFDAVPPLGIPREISAPGYERTTLAPLFEKTAAEFGLKVISAAHPESGGYYRSDHFSFARLGIPAFSIEPGSRFGGHPESWVRQRAFENDRNYHQPGDEFSASDDYRANALISRFAIALAYRAANMPDVLQWKPKDEFRKDRGNAGGER